MTFEEWQISVKKLSKDAEDAMDTYKYQKAVLDHFLKETIGFESNSVATLEGTAVMVSKIIDMKNTGKV